MTKTRAELATLILEKLFVLEGGETADATDQAKVTKVIDSRVEFLRSKEGAYWDADEVPDDLFDVLAEYMLHYVSPVMTAESGGEYVMRREEALRDMRAIIVTRSDDSPIQTDYY